MEELIQICSFLQSSVDDNYKRCEYFLSNFNKDLKYLKELFSLFNFSLICLFNFVGYFFYKKNYKHISKTNFFLIINFFCYFFLIINNYHINLPWSDDLHVLENVLINENKYQGLFKDLNGHLIFFYNILLYLNNVFFDLKYFIFSYFSFFLYLFVFFLFKQLYEETVDSSQRNIFFYLILLNGKFFVIFFQTVNTVWLISLLLIILLILDKNFKNENYFQSKKNFFLTISGILNFGLGLVIPLYVMFLSLIKKKINLNFLISLILLGIFFYYTKNLQLEDENQNLIFVISNINKILITFFVLLGNIFVPWISKSYYFSGLIGFFQFIYVLIYLINFKKKDFHNFCRINSLLLISLVGCALIAISRADPYNAISPRYFIISLMFQCGFLFIIQQVKYDRINFYIKKILYLLIVISLIVSHITPFLGIHFVLQKYAKEKIVVDCFEKNRASECIILAKNILTIQNKNENIKDFKIKLNYLKQKQLINWTD